MEVWKKIPDHEEYEASTHGRIRSVDREYRDSRGYHRKVVGKVLKAHVNPDSLRHSDRYPHVMLGRGKMRRVHQLVAWTFIGPQAKGLYVCHRNGIKTDCRPDNLYYGTAVENQQDRKLHGTGWGENHPNARLTVNDVKVIKRLLRDGVSQTKIAAQFDIDQASISNINTGRRWAHVELTDED